MGLVANNAPRAANGNVPKSIRDIFKPSTQLEHVAGLKIAVWGRAKTGKSHLAFTCPRPIYGIDTEGAWSLNKNQFDRRIQEETHVSQVLYMADKDKNVVDLPQSLDAARDAMDVLTDYILYNDRVTTYMTVKQQASIEEICKAVTPEKIDPKNETIVQLVTYVLEEMNHYGSATVSENGTWTFVKPMPRGTIVLDSGTDIWDWLGIWKDESFTNEKTKRLDWGHANKRYNQFLVMMLHSKWNVLGSFKAEAAVSDKGADLKFDKPKWQKKTDYWFDVIIELQKRGNERVAIFRGDRYGGLTDELENPTWDSIVELLESRKKVKVT